MEYTLNQNDLSKLREIGMDRIIDDLSIFLADYGCEDRDLCRSELTIAFTALEKKIGLNPGEEYYYKNDHIL